jgi:hypothetical protein
VLGTSTSTTVDGINSATLWLIAPVRFAPPLLNLNLTYVHCIVVVVVVVIVVVVVVVVVVLIIVESTPRTVRSGPPPTMSTLLNWSETGQIATCFEDIPNKCCVIVKSNV